MMEGTTSFPSLLPGAMLWLTSWSVWSFFGSWACLVKSWILLLVSGVADAAEAEEMKVVMADGL